MRCRHCETKLEHTLIDLGSAPPSNSYLTKADLSKPEIYYPLRVMVCTGCWLIQTEDFANHEDLFSDDYAYFSSASSSWLEHSRKYFEQVVKKLDLDNSSYVVEIASNDGYLLKNFVGAGIPCLGIEPTSSTAAASEEIGVPVLKEFFTAALADGLARESGKADLIIANNVLAHVPNINDFVLGVSRLLKPGGVATFEFPHVLNLVRDCQFDTIYHEHFSYLSLAVVTQILQGVGLEVWDVEKLSTQGGSLRVWCSSPGGPSPRNSVRSVLDSERTEGLESLTVLGLLQSRAEGLKDDLVSFLLKSKSKGKIVVGYGAAAKGNTFLNFAGVRRDLIPRIYDAAPSKQGKYLPGSHIPIIDPSGLSSDRASLVIAFPWNLRAEIREVLNEHDHGKTPLVTTIPRLEIR